MGAEEKLKKGAAVAGAVGGLLRVLIDVEREDGDGRVDRVTLFGLIPVYDRARRARRLARRRDEEAQKERDAR